MRGEWKETEAMSQRELRLGELLMLSLEIMKKHMGSFFILAILVYLPAAAGQQYQLSQIVPTEDITELAQQMIPLLIWSAVLSFISMIGPMVITILVVNELYGEEKMSFPKVFDRGIRRWLAAAVTQVLILVSLGMFSVFTGMMLGVFPVLVLTAVPVLMVVLLYYNMMQNCSAAVASLHGLMAWNCLRYIRSLFRERIFRGIGVYALIWLIGNIPGQLIHLVVSELLMPVENPWLVTGILTVLQALLGIFTLFVATATILMLFNYENMRQREWKEKQEQAAK